jgi:hypothetical protein
MLRLRFKPSAPNILDNTRSSVSILRSLTLLSRVCRVSASVDVTVSVVDVMFLSGGSVFDVRVAMEFGFIEVGMCGSSNVL